MKKLPIILSLCAFTSIGFIGGYFVKTAIDNKSKGSSTTSVSSSTFSSSSIASTSFSSSIFSSSSSSSSVSSVPTINHYTVSFKNYDNTLLSESIVEEGKTAVYNGQTPTRAETSEFTYTFNGWDKSLENITSDCVRVAQYIETAKPVTPTYNVSFKNYDGTVLYEEVVEEGGNATYVGDTPARPETVEYRYTFSGWNQSLENITSDRILVAQYTEIQKPITPRYTVTFKNYDGTVLQEVSVEEGNTATYSGPTPTRTNTPEFVYAFSGWDQPLNNIVTDCVRIAQYTQTNIEYTVKFYNYDDQLLYTDTVYYQQAASYYGPTPTRPSTAAYTYTFAGWDKDISCITKSITVKALFDAHGVASQITVNPSNGESTSILDVTYGDTYDLGTPEFTGFTFLGWYTNTNQLVATSGTWEYTGVTSVTAKWGSLYFEFLENGDSTYTVSLSEAGKNVKEVIIPETFEGLMITALGENFAKQNTVIEKVTIPGTIKDIPNYSFYGCSKLSEVVFNEGLETIGQHAFESCKFTKLLIPSTCISIGTSAFEYNRSLYHVYIPSSVTTMGGYAFDSLTGSAYICIEHDAVPSAWSSNWTSSVIYTGSTKLVEGTDFNYVIRNVYGTVSATILRLSEETSKLTSYVVPNEIEGLTDIRLAQYLFSENKYIHNIDLSSVTRIGTCAFFKCTNLETITFSNSLTVIGTSAFRYCSSITRVVIPDSVTEIQNLAFDTCSNLTYIYIPSTVVTINSYAFDECNKSTIYTNAHSATSGWVSNFKGSQPIYYDFVSLNETEDFNYVVQSYMGSDYVTITGLKASAKQKQNIVIPNEIEGINDIRLCNSLFYGLSQLVSIDLGSGVTQVPAYCFQSCSNLVTVTLHEGVTTIGQKAFCSCNKLSSINMPSSLTSIGSQAFDYCYALREVRIPIGVTTIGSYAFDDSNKMALLIEASVAQPGWSSSWYGTSGAKQFVYDYVSSGVINDLRYAKASNGVTDTIYILGLVEGSQIMNVVVPDQIEGVSNITITNNAFEGNTIIKTVDLGNSVTYIGTYAFKGNSSLVSIIIPFSCTVIKNDAFNNLNSSCVINCEAPAKPDGWETNWNRASYTVVWGYIR